MLIAVVNLIPFSCRRNRPTFFLSGVEMSMSFDTVSADDIQFLLHLAKMALTNNEKKRRELAHMEHATDLKKTQVFLCLGWWIGHDNS